METLKTKKSTRIKRSESFETAIDRFKKAKLTKTDIGIIGSFVTESTIYFKPSFMFMIGKDTLFKIREDYKLYKTIYRPFVVAINELLFDALLDSVYAQYKSSNPPKINTNIAHIKKPKNFKKILKKQRFCYYLKMV